MHLLNSRQRGQTSLLAIGITSWMTLVALTQFQVALLPQRAAGFNEARRCKDLILANTLPDVFIRSSSLEDRGEDHSGETSFRWESAIEETPALRLQYTQVHFNEHEHWPTTSGLLVEGLGFYLFIRDYK